MKIVHSCFFAIMLTFALGGVALLNAEGAEFIIITYDGYYEYACSLAQWKYSKGIPTTVIKLTEINPAGNPTKEEIKEFIQDAYNSWIPQPHYVLLLGTQLQIPYWRYAGAPIGDTPYGDMVDDERCEIAIARMAPYSIAECQTMIFKTLNYEREPSLSSQVWYENATIVQNNDPEGNYWYYQTCEFLNQWLYYWGYTSVDYLKDFEGDDRQDVIDAVNEDRMFVVYRGSSHRDRWYDPFDFFPDALESNWQLPIIVSGTCETANFADQYSMCNRWLRAGNATSPKGSVAFIGATHPVAGEEYSEGRHLVTVGIFMGIFDYDEILGDAFLFGKDYMYGIYNQAYRGFEYHGWTLIGDPTLRIWTNTPKIMSVEHLGAIEMDDPTDIIVTVTDQQSGLPIQDAKVTLYKPGASVDDPEVYFSLQTNSGGVVVFNDVTANTAGKLKVTVDYHYYEDNYLPYQGEIGVFEIMTNDPYALAFNGNRHLARASGGVNDIHIVYTDNGHIYYRYSTDYGSNWSSREDIGVGKYPCLAIKPNNTPVIAFTKENGGLYFSKKSGSSWQVWELYNPVTPIDPIVNSPPTIAIIPVDLENAQVNILATFTGQNPMDENVVHEVRHYYFDFTNPSSTYNTIETAIAPASPLRRHHPSLVRNEIDNSLHAAWMRLDTLCYARKYTTGSWVRYGNPFYNDGLNSSYPSMECYGDSIYCVWQQKVSPTSPEEVWRARRSRTYYQWFWNNLSTTPSTASHHPVNASGVYTVFADNAGVSGEYDAFFKTKPLDPLTNLSQTADKSYYPQAVARFTLSGNHLYTVWLEGNQSPYEIKFKDYYVATPKDEIAYFSSSSGDSIASPYLINRDGYLPDWQIPVDYGVQNLRYSFPLEPGYLYKLKTVAYHERTGQWQGLAKVENEHQFAFKYRANTPESLSVWIPEHLYQDSLFEFVIDRITGDFASIGPVYLYRYETAAGNNGGPQAERLMKTGFTGHIVNIYPNPAKDHFTVNYAISRGTMVHIAIYDACGRVVQEHMETAQEPGNYAIQLHDLNLAQGIYFVRLETNENSCVSKVILIK